MMLFSSGIVCVSLQSALSMANVFGGSDLTLVGRDHIYSVSCCPQKSVISWFYR
jgi:hypothetical protein